MPQVPEWLTITTGVVVVLPGLDKSKQRFGHKYRVVRVKLSAKYASGVAVALQPLSPPALKRDRWVDMSLCARADSAKGVEYLKTVKAEKEKNMDNREKLLKALELLAALKPHVDPNDQSELRLPFNGAWARALNEAAKAAMAYANMPEEW